MSEIQVGKVGKILAGDDVGRYIKVVDDSDSTGGFLILTSDDPDFERGYDNWVEDRTALLRYFQESGWQVEWLS